MCGKCSCSFMKSPWAVQGLTGSLSGQGQTPRAVCPADEKLCGNWLLPVKQLLGCKGQAVGGWLCRDLFVLRPERGSVGKQRYGA